MNKKEEMFQKFREMNKTELVKYQSAAGVASRFIDCVGISVILGMLFFANMLTIVGGLIFLYVFSHIGANIDETIEYLDRLIIRASDK
jgi:hypothetical protein